MKARKMVESGIGTKSRRNDSTICRKFPYAFNTTAQTTTVGHPGRVYATKMAIRKHSNTFTLN